LGKLADQLEERNVIETLRDEEWELETGRLLLSPMYATDAERLYEWLQEPALHSFIGREPPESAHQLKTRIRLWEHRQSAAGDEVWLNWTLRVADRAMPDNGAVVGYVQATIKANQTNLAWVIGLPFQGRGYATEAARRVAGWLTKRPGISELRANIHPAHAASQAVARRVGLHRSAEVTEAGEEVWVLRS